MFLNIQGENATGSMVTFLKGQPDKNFYRKFKIKTQTKPNDVAMLKEILIRRFSHLEWGWPDLILIDGGKAQLNIASKVKEQMAKSKNIRIIALAKNGDRLYLDNQKEPIFLSWLPNHLKFILIRLRDEAHRFALQYHRKLREKIW